MSVELAVAVAEAAAAVVEANAVPAESCTLVLSPVDELVARLLAFLPLFLEESEVSVGPVPWYDR